jgi:hypothetical protein
MSAMPFDRKKHLAQRKVGRPHYPTDGPRTADFLAAHGRSEYVFGWASVPAAHLWKTARCAPDGQTA